MMLSKSQTILALALLTAPAGAQQKIPMYSQQEKAPDCLSAYGAAQRIILNHEVVTRKEELTSYEAALAQAECKAFLDKEMAVQTVDLTALLPSVTCESVLALAESTLASSPVTQRRQAILDASAKYLFTSAGDPCGQLLHAKYPKPEYYYSDPYLNFKTKIANDGDAELSLTVAYFEGKFFEKVSPKSVPPYGIADMGISGNFAALNTQNGLPMAGFAGHASIFGNGRVFRSSDHTYPGGENLMARLSFDGNVAINNDGKTDGTIGGLQARAAAGVFEDNGVYYAPFYNYNFDGSYVDGYTKNTSINSFGGELGKKLTGKDRVFYIGVYTGLAAVHARNGKKLDAGKDGVPVLDAEGKQQFIPHNFDRTVPTVGVSVLGRIGEPNKQGAVYIDGTAEYMAGAGTRSNLSIDVNVSKHLKVGGGVRQVTIEDPLKGKLVMVVPALKVTLGLNNQSGYKK